MRVWRAAGLAVAALVFFAALVVVNYRMILLRNTEQTRFDALIVLGSPANPDGSVSPEERTRVMEAVREFREGVAPHVILTGGAAHNGFVEAEVMAGLAAREGVPVAAIFEEPQAQNTIQNVYYSSEIMKAHGWTSAEVVSSRSHLPRAALILRHYDFGWRLDAAPWPAEFLRGRVATIYAYEALECLRLRMMGFTPSPFLPIVAHR